MKSIKYILLGLIFINSIQSRAQNCEDLFNQKNIIEIKKSQLVINGVAQPNLFGAEVQYFRLRGGYEKNVPREKVLEIWGRALDQVVAAGMNTVSFYIPWDFHEYAPGKFDFTGTADVDGDGIADYPSRDILTFLKMIEARGIKHILIRPGPYVNAEWGFLGFGAVPEWFHEKYPESHMQSSQGFKTKLYDYHNEDFLRHTKLWFEELNRQVLVNVIGKNKPGIFLQLDNETNFQWQSLYNHDYGPNATLRYQNYLKNKYRNLENLNQSQNTSIHGWSEARPPKVRGQNLTQDIDWYKFQDKSIYTYLQKIKMIWQDIGITEPNVIFTVAESFNAPTDGLLPNYNYKNSRTTGLMTINVYPKTWPGDALFHQPHKSDWDIIAAMSANKRYYESKQQYVMGPEVQTGWFGNTVLTPEARQQTYLTLLGRGMKALYFYYFNEGENWQVEWGRNQIQAYYDKLAKDPRFLNTAMDQLPDNFWIELQNIVDSQFMAGWPVKNVMFKDDVAAQKLSFGAPLNGNAEPTENFNLIQSIGQKIIKPYGEFLSRTLSLNDKVAILTDAGSLSPSAIPGVDSRQLHSDFAGGLVGYLLQGGINPTVHHWGINSVKDLAQNKIIFVQDSGNLNPHLIQWLTQYIKEGGTVVNFIGDTLAKQIGAPATSKVTSTAGALRVSYQSPTRQTAPVQFDAMALSVSEYTLGGNPQAQAILSTSDKTVGYQYNYQKGVLIQIGAVVHDAFNSDAYGILNDVPQRRQLLDDLVKATNIQTQFHILEGGDRVDVFGRQAPHDENLWVTVKSGRLDQTAFHVVFAANLISMKKMYQIKNVLTGETQNLDGKTLSSTGLPVRLKANGSAAFIVQAL